MTPDQLPPSPIRPQHDYVLAVKLKSNDSRIVLPDGTDDARNDVYVLEVGPGRTNENGITFKPDVKRGDKILVDAPGCSAFQRGIYTFIVVPMYRIFGVIDESAVAYLESQKVGHVLSKGGIAG